MAENDIYDVFLEQFGFPGSARLRAVLEYLMTPEQAQMVAALPGSPKEVAEKTGFDEDKVRSNLEELFYSGVITPRGDFENRNYYRFQPMIAGLYDRTQGNLLRDMKKEKKLYELWDDFEINEEYPRMAAMSKKMYEEGNLMMRIVPAWRSIKDLPDVLPYENYHEILKAQSRIAVAPCACRISKAAVGKPCERHDETKQSVCFQFNRSADYVIARGSGEEVTLDEAIELCDNVIEEDGLIHGWGNNAGMTGMIGCNCCPDCCEGKAPLVQANLPIVMESQKSRYLPYVILEDCTGCQVCVDRCPADAIEMEKPEGSKKFKPVINEELCIGCGACVVGCEAGALKMKAVRPPEFIPAEPPPRPRGPAGPSPTPPGPAGSPPMPPGPAGSSPMPPGPAGSPPMPPGPAGSSPMPPGPAGPSPTPPKPQS